MVQKYFLYLILFVFLIACESEIKKIDIGTFDKTNYWQKNQYTNLQRLRQTPVDSIVDYLEYYATLESIYGNVKTAQRIMDTVQIIRNDVNDFFDSSIKYFESKNAIATIATLTKGKNLVLINEAHHRPEHRIFTTKLLKTLKQQGFEYLALEGLNMRDNLLQKRGFPTNESGIYIQNTAYANLIRTALKLNIKVIAYDVFSKNSNERDSLQAVNIYQQSFAKNPAAKVIVHAGYGHISKSTYGNEKGKPMGFFLANLTGNNALSISQTEVIEHEISSQKDKNYQYLINKTAFKNPIILENENRFWSQIAGFDVNIIHPPIKLMNHRPKYLFFDNYQAFEIPITIQKKEYLNHLIKVFKANEPNSAVPIDQFEFVNFDMKIIVPSGKYRIEVYDTLGKVVEFLSINF